MNAAMIYHAYQFLVWAEIDDLIIQILEEHVDFYINAGEEVPGDLIKVLSAFKDLIKEGKKL